MKIGVIGNGVVGSAVVRTWLEHCDEIRVWDDKKERRTHSMVEALACDISFVCLPEGAVEEFCKDWDSMNFGPNDENVVLKSTVPIGTTRRLREQYQLPNLIHSPEFLTARCAFTDAQCPTRNIIGVPGGAATLGYSAPCYDLLYDLYEKRFPGVQILNMTSDESEAVKLMVNSFFAVKVAFFNEIRSLCDKLGLDWETVRAGILSDGRIAHSHTQVPGPDGKYGFGGACLPKDLKMLVELMEKDGSKFENYPFICNAAYERNKLDREKT